MQRHEWHCCQHCGKFKSDVIWNSDPYEQEVHSKLIYSWMCSECREKIIAKIGADNDAGDVLSP